MAGTSGSSAGGGGGGKPLPPPRPTITVPSRSSTESALFRSGGASEASPGPLTLVSSFFAEDPETECRPFTQLLVDAMNFPARAKAEQEDVAVVGTGAGGGVVWSGQNRLLSLQATSSPQLFTVPPGLSPARLLDSPATLFSSSHNMGNFGLTYQSALPQVKAQAETKIPSQQENHSSCLQAATTSLAQQPVPEIPLTRSSSITFESSEEWSQPAANFTDKPADDGYNWRKYGQKMVRGSEYPRGYYKCTHPNCSVTKKVERSVDGQVTEIIYKGQHNHQCPRPNKQSKEGHNFPTSGLSETSSYGAHGNSVPSISSRDHEHSLSEPSDKVLAETRTAEEEDVSGPDPKIRCTSVSSQKTSAEPRIVVQTTSEVDLLDDGYRWRKYGQKVVKGSTHPRSYYKCTYVGCNVRKHIERASSDPRAVITTYEGKHNHELPAARNSSHHTANAVAAAHQMQLDHDSLISTNFRRNHQAPLATLQLKEEDK